MPWTDQDHGYKRPGPSESAANLIAPSAKIVRAKVMELLHRNVFPMTADEIADALNIDPFTVRPRVSELARDGRLKDSGLRRPGNRGRTQTCWEIA